MAEGYPVSLDTLIARTTKVAVCTVIFMTALPIVLASLWISQINERRRLRRMLQASRVSWQQPEMYGLHEFDVLIAIRKSKRDGGLYLGPRRYYHW
jgi:hypothetical protein